MIELKPFKIEDWKYLKKWISSESELVQFAGQIFSFPVDRKQVESYLSVPNQTVFKIENENGKSIGISEINIAQNNVARLARILIGDKSMRGKGIGIELINKLTEYGFNNLKAERILLNVYSWNMAAVKCYEKVGFSHTDKPIKYVKVGNEEWRQLKWKKPVAKKVYSI